MKDVPMLIPIEKVHTIQRALALYGDTLQEKADQLVADVEEIYTLVEWLADQEIMASESEQHMQEVENGTDYETVHDD